MSDDDPAASARSSFIKYSRNYARHGHIEVLMWAHANGCMWNEATCANAAAGGSVEVLRALRPPRRPPPSGRPPQSSASTASLMSAGGPPPLVRTASGNVPSEVQFAPQLQLQ